MELCRLNRPNGFVQFAPFATREPGLEKSIWICAVCHAGARTEIVQPNWICPVWNSLARFVQTEIVQPNCICPDATCGPRGPGRVALGQAVWTISQPCPNWLDYSSKNWKVVALSAEIVHALSRKVQ